MDLLTNTVVPTWVMVIVVALLTLSLIFGVPLARAAGRRRGRRLAHPEEYTTLREKAKDTALFLAALIPSLLVWLAVMGVSFIGLTGFAKDVMDWDHWTNTLVPLSLDGISVSFGAWAFVAVKRGRHPGRAYKIVLAAAAMSAVLNFVHGRDTWSIWAGAYLAFLSFAGMAMFHELLDQFMAAYDDEVALKTRYPRFGQRWLYAPLSTFAARRAWIVHPPAEGTRPSVREALDHLTQVREDKRQRKLGNAQLVRESARAKLIEVQAKNEVRAAKRGQSQIPHIPAQQVAAGPAVDAAAEERVAEALRRAEAAEAQLRAERDERERQRIAEQEQAALQVQRERLEEQERQRAAEAERVRQAEIARRRELDEQRERQRIAAQQEAEAQRARQRALDEQRRSSEREQPAPVHNDGEQPGEGKPLREVFEQLRGSQPLGVAKPEPVPSTASRGPLAQNLALNPVPAPRKDSAGPAKSEGKQSTSVRAQVPQILDAHVRPGDDLAVTRLTGIVMKVLGPGANAESVRRYVATWTKELSEGKRELKGGPRLSVVNSRAEAE